MPIKRGKDHHRFRRGQAAYRKPSIAYRRWSDMLTRCRNEKSKSYPRYGGRGIKVCERWLLFDRFHEDMGDPPTPRHQLERKDNAGHYEPGNCRWATPKEQANNRRSSRVLEYQGRKQTLQAWCDELGLNHPTVSMRLNKYGWSIDKALGTPSRGWSPGKPKT